MATINFAENLLILVKILHNRNVQYLVVGGTAIAFHGYVRPTTTRDGTVLDKDDFDFWFNPTYPNYMRLLDAFEDMGLDITGIREEEYPDVKRSFFQFKPKDYSLDFLPKVGGGLIFRDCYQQRIVSMIEGTEISIIAIEDLIICKKATGRKKDLEDIEFLEAKRRK